MDKKLLHNPRLPALSIVTSADESLERKPVDWSAKRHAPTPYDSSLNLATVAWLEQLPHTVVPRETAHRYPRILNRLARYWDAPHMLDTVFEDLLLDKRGGRMGFPREIEAEICALDNYYRSLHPIQAKDAWSADPDCVQKALRKTD